MARNPRSLRQPTGPRIDPSLMGELAARLTDRDHDLLATVFEHRVLTTHQIEHIFFTRPQIARRRLAVLHRLAALERFRPWAPTGSSPCHWVLGPAGAAVLAAQRGISVAQLGYRRDAAMSICFSSRLGHLIGVNDFFTCLHRSARQSHASARVAEWWSERRCAALWGDLARPDAYGRWIENGDQVDFFLEHDTGSEPLAKVVRKLDDYADLAETTGITTPVLLWLPSTRREANLRELIGVPEAPVATAVHTLIGDGPAGPVWLPCGSQGPRRRLIELADVPP
ncbi:hypothetical protein GCM10010156_64640 [Planobispora rosea]|uniref:Replication-relaxation n=1 Tax=Planobispora rosea TaxID=35762 RepID=A0A8J3WFY9_PLARO|nr:replication-relaxation family protein [Planobispora rosea]GGS97510.1 hypothetical protein GCM10010156_64640 [Planobispora rosea]GIH87858.1 hypothetical protein Pro02_62660 [Planobispora rosea]